MFNRKNRDSDTSEIIAEALASDPAELEKDAGPIGRAFISAVDKAVHLQSGTIRAYVHWLRRQNPDASPEEIQNLMAKHFRNTVTGTGAGVGATAAVPGIGLITGSAAVAAESVLFLDLAAFYTVAAAYLRGEDISDPERRRAIVLTTLMGTQGVAVVDALLGDDTSTIPGKHTMAKFSGPGLAEANNILTRVAMRSLGKDMRRAWLGKLLPLGLGAIAGRAANRKLADAVLDNVQSSLGPTPVRFLEPLPAKEDEDDEVKAVEAKLSTNPREFAAWIMQIFGRGKGEDKAAKAGKNAKAGKKEAEGDE
ncbi:hypothetical protein JKI95_02190 [Corynebacterium aquatimens]|uniref:hypothetical protein n=1 Tax=Corynebacterium TaxID=1716 RepID=UPI001F1DC43B|nr:MULTISPECIES: hypothetical protein [Corynebacterium]QYH19920.1 hypothetical protein JKI95_02190 [Corynebacterium aquatimens]UIZ92912.1 hypothetical protein JZY91_03970 [Corynebacterium sp. CNCTC7651]